MCYIAQAGAKDADKGTAETEGVPLQLAEKTFYLRVTVLKGAVCSFTFSTDGQKFVPVGTAFKAREGRWIAMPVLARVGAGKPQGFCIVHSRIADLRERGLVIHQRNRWEDGVVLSFYRLVAA